MADGDVVKMRLTFWRDNKKPGDVIEIPADEVHRWDGFAVQEGDPYPSGETTTPTAAQAEYPRPADGAKVDDWRTYAIGLGMERGDADKATKADLITYADTTTAGAQA
ncbi:hypothetical protein ACIQPQ_31160 [Streptomyces sp. NPDC091281]|uniref:hypothetical protein n=1 Tax=Streptomyces sp. NPDC091281 TaxID=3365985 RepID=UPI0038261710